MSDIDALASEISQGKLFLHLLVKLLCSDLLHTCIIVFKFLLQVEVSLCTCPDLPFIQGLLEMIPFASDDLEARSALWSIVARLLVKVQEDEMRPSSLHQYVSVLVSSSDMIEDDLLDHQLDETSHCIPCGFKRSARVTAVSSLTC